MGLTAPPEETAWLLHHILGFEALEEADTSAVLQEITRTAEGVLAPLDRDGDRVGARLGEQGVIAAPGFAEAFHVYTEAGWMGIAASSDYGGQDLPHVLGLAALEPVSSANMAFGLCPLLTQDAITLLQAHGSVEQRQRWLPHLIAGRWTGTMCLSEPQAGSDLSSVRTRATPDGNGGYLIRGEKIFITWGDHGMTENILHLVLARLPGSRCPRCCPTDDATPWPAPLSNTNWASMAARPARSRSRTPWESWWGIATAACSACSR
jgi:hypothetical protein